MRREGPSQHSLCVLCVTGAVALCGPVSDAAAQDSPHEVGAAPHEVGAARGEFGAEAHAMLDFGLFGDEDKEWFCIGFIGGVLGTNPKDGPGLIPRMFPMPDKEHARNAKSRAAQARKAGNLTQDELERIDRKADKILDD